MNKQEYIQYARYDIQERAAIEAGEATTEQREVSREDTRQMHIGGLVRLGMGLEAASKFIGAQVEEI